MGCQSSVFLGNNLTFSICTHDPDTGVLTDADVLPTYRLYEDETAIPILTGTMAILDNLNTVGFYTELVACTAGNGFESGRTYTVYIEATVDSDTGGICYAFTVEDAPLPCSVCIAYTYTVTDSGTGLPIDGVHVWVTTDAGGANVIWCGYTDAFGVARDAAGNVPLLDAGTYYFWKQRVAYVDDQNPDVEVVS